MTAEISVFKDEEAIAKLNPAQAIYHKSQKRTSEVAIRRTLAGDLYLALEQVDSDTEKIMLKVRVKPLINWIWIGSTISVIGALLVLLALYRRRSVPAKPLTEASSVLS